MLQNPYREGLLVRHPGKPEWGIGKILQLLDKTAKVSFRDDLERDYRALRLDHVALEIAEQQTDPVLDNLPPFLGDRFAVEAKRVTLEDGMRKFLEHFPGGFADTSYIGDGSLGKSSVGERAYKVHAHELFKASFGEGRGEQRLRDNKIGELVQDLLHIVVGKTNLLSPFENMALSDGLKASGAAATGYFEALLEFIAPPKPGPDQFARLASAVENLPVSPGKAKVATWPVLTVAPFLARPDAFVFLKPEPTRACAERIRFEIHYSAELRWTTYSSVSRMSHLLMEWLAPRGARDYIDVQSFMWIIAKY